MLRLSALRLGYELSSAVRDCFDNPELSLRVAYNGYYYVSAVPYRTDYADTTVAWESPINSQVVDYPLWLERIMEGL